MTRDPRNDPAYDPNRPDRPIDADADADDQTRVVERQTYVERERPPERYDPPPASYANPTPAGSQVNVNDRGGAYVDTSPGPLYYARRVVSLLFGILAVLMLLRIIFLLLVANISNPIVDFVLGVTEPFVAPFRGIFNFDNVSLGDATLDIAALVALIGWFLIYLLIIAILSIGDRRTA